MTKIITYFLSITLLFISTTSNAYYSSKTGADVLTQCSHAVSFMDAHNPNSPYYADLGWCMGFIEGISQVELRDAVVIANANKNNNPDLKKYLDYCSPKNATLEQDMRIITKYLKDHPEKLNAPGAVLVIEALRQAFPCK